MLVCLLLIPFKFVSASTEEKVYTSASINDEFADNKVMVVLKQDESKNDKTYTRRDFKNISCKNVVELLSQTSKLIKKENNKRILCLDLKQNSKKNVLDVCNELMSRDDVLYAGPDYKISACSTTSNDTHINEQWAINNINLPKTWDYVTGSSSVLVGVMDSGIYSSHSELSSRVDWNLSRSFVSGYSESYDNTGHGTHVAGIIGAIGNNGQGVCGVNWDVKLVSLRVLDNKNDGSICSFISAIDYANTNNIPILNFSVEVESTANDYEMNYVLNTAFEAYDGLIVCAAGNENSNNDGNVRTYPASCTADNIISVGAHNEHNLRWYDSNYGLYSVDIYAPGDEILSTYPDIACSYDVTFSDGTRLCEMTPDNQIFLIQYVERDENDDITWESIQDRIVFYNIFKNEPKEYKCSTHYANGYHYMSGTSMAAPYVSGVAALLLAHNPSLTALQLKEAILTGSDTISITLPDQTTQTVKKLNAYKALNTIHSCTYEYVSYSSHSATCDCGVSILLPHNFSYGWVSTLKHKAFCDCGTFSEPHTVIRGKNKCLLCGGKADIGFAEAYSLSKNRVYITEAGSYVLPNGTIVLVEADIEDFLKGTLHYLN